MKTLMLTFSLVWLISINLAHAQPKVAALNADAMGHGSQDIHFSHAVEFIVDGNGGVFNLALYQALITTIQFPEPIEDCDVYNDQDFRIWCQRDVVKIVLHKQNPRRLPASFVVTTPSFATTFLVNAADTRQQAVSFGIVKQRTDVEKFNTAVAQEAGRLFETETSTIEKKVRHQDELTFAADIHRRHEPVTVEYTPRDESGLDMKITGGVMVGDDLHLFYELYNRGQKSRDIAELKVFDRNAEKNLADLVYVDSPGRGARERNLIAVVERGERTTGSVVIRDVENVATESLALGIMGPEGTQPMWIRDIRVAPYILKPPPDADRASFYFQPIIGMISIHDPLAPDQTKLALLTGASLRFTFAMREWSRFAFEGELAGARAGTATFPNVSLEGQSGELERGTGLIRAMGGIRLRFGRRWMPTVHFAIGMQGTSRSSQLRLENGNLVPGPGGISWDIPLRLGIGVDRRLSKNWVAGARMSGITYQTDSDTVTSGSLEAGLHLGYYWDVLR